ncbi:hypothetical protein PVAP13_2NG126403 [Panicum virgatum]|uniref:Uncharacterized protein n=1 Tax=Panicum virgatum TaxID=38727 RepID=A0A8T0VMA0_PANVG|nr:hypothetical protein PVAP13_2NG126403 [Panicum virgatum]
MPMSAPPLPASSSSPAWLEWAAEYTKAAQAESRSPPEWAARVAAASAAGESGDVPWSAGLAEVLARALLSGGGEPAAAAAAWKYAEAALAARLASPALLLALLSTRYGHPAHRWWRLVSPLVWSVAGGGIGNGECACGRR